MAKSYIVDTFFPGTESTKDENLIALSIELEKNLRDEDVEDLIASCGDVGFGIIGSMKHSEVLHAFRDEAGKLLIVVGLGRFDMGCVGRSIWAVGTKELANGHSKFLVGEGKKLIDGWAQKYGLLFNCVHENNRKSIRFMTALGAVWLPEGVEVDGHKFLNFYIVGGGK